MPVLNSIVSGLKLVDNLGRVKDEFGNEISETFDSVSESLRKAVSGDLGTVFEYMTPNILDEVDSPTYHFRLFMTKEAGKVTIPGYNINEYDDVADLTRDKRGSGTKPILLAETGASRVAIDNVEIEVIPSHSRETKTAQSTKFSFQIVEPNSATFFDDMRLAADILDNDAFYKCSYVLDLSFLGRSYEESAPARLDRRWWYSIAITNVSMNVSASGTTYDVEAIAYGDHGLSSATGKLYGSLTLQEGAGSAQQVFTAVEDMMNSPVGKSLVGASSDSKESGNANNRIYQNKYYIHVDPELGDLKFNTVDLRENTSTQTDTYEKGDSGGDKGYAFAKGTSIVDLINNVMSVTNMVKEVKDKSDKKTDKADAATIVPLYKIITRTIPVNIKNEFPITSGGNANNITSLVDNNLVKINPESGDYSKVIIYYIMKHETARPYVNNEQAITKTSSALRLDKLKTLVKKRYDYIFTGLNDQVIDFNLDFNTSFLIPFSSTTTNKDAQNLQAASDVNVESDQPPPSNNFSTQQPGHGVLKPEYLASTGTSKADSDQLGLESTPDGSRSFFNAILSQQMSGTDLVQIDMKIKGDPDWLGRGIPTTSETYNRLELDNTVKTKANDFAFKALEGGDEYTEKRRVTDISFVKNQPMLVFRAVPPRYYNEDTGLYEVNQNVGNTVINGLYNVIKLTNNFSGGVFTQTLECNKEYRIFPDTIEEALNRKKS